MGVLKFGTVHWELDVIETHRFDEAHGIDMRIVELGSKRATAVALQGGGADIIVTDWIWVSRQRAEGRDYAFVPYSLAVGGLIVRPDAGIAELADLRGRQVGVAGGPVDKSWLLLQAYAKQAGMDLSEAVEPTFGAPPLLNELIDAGRPAGSAQFLALQRPPQGTRHAGAPHHRRDSARAGCRAAHSAARLGLQSRLGGTQPRSARTDSCARRTPPSISCWSPTRSGRGWSPR